MINQEDKIIEYLITPEVNIITLLNLISSLAKNNKELQNLSENEIQSISKQSTNLALQILNNMSKTQPNIPNINELKMFIKNEVEKIYNDPNIVNGNEYSNYIIKPNKETLLNYVILLSDDDLLFNLYSNWLSQKKICNLLINIYKSNSNNNENNVDFINFLISINDLFNKFSSPEIVELDNNQHGGILVISCLVLLSSFTYFNTASAFSIETSIRAITESPIISKSVVRDLTGWKSREELLNKFRNEASSNDESKDMFSKFKHGTTEILKESEIYIINKSLNLLADYYDVSPEERRLEGNTALYVTKSVINNLASWSQSDVIRGISIMSAGLFGNNALKGLFGEDRTKYASTQIINKMYELGLSSADVYRLLDTLENVFDNIIPFYEKKVNLSITQKPGPMQTIVNVLNEPITQNTLNIILDMNGLGYLKGLKNFLISAILTPNENMKENLKMLKEYQSDVKNGKDYIKQILYSVGEYEITQKTPDYQKNAKKRIEGYNKMIDYSYEGGNKLKINKKYESKKYKSKNYNFKSKKYNIKRKNKNKSKKHRKVK